VSVQFLIPFYHYYYVLILGSCSGLTAYNHNLDTSREFYPSVITTRTYDERLDTITAVRDAGISVCSGGILGLGETDKDRVGLIWEVSW